MGHSKGLQGRLRIGSHGLRRDHAIHGGRIFDASSGRDPRYAWTAKRSGFVQTMEASMGLFSTGLAQSPALAGANIPGVAAALEYSVGGKTIFCFYSRRANPVLSVGGGRKNRSDPSHLESSGGSTVLLYVERGGCGEPD